MLLIAGFVLVSFSHKSEVHAWAETDIPIYEKTITGKSDVDSLNSPISITIDNSNNLFVVDTGNHRILKFNDQGVFQLEIGSNGTGDGEFISPYAVDFDTTGNLYVADYGNNRIQKFDSSGSFIMKFGTPGSGDGEFNQPVDVKLDSYNNIYVVDRINSRIQKFNNSGTFLMKFGTNGAGDGELNYPAGMDMDSNGNIYVIEFFNHRVQKFDSNGNYVMKFGSNGTENGQFYVPAGIHLDPNDNIYVADYGNNRIQKFDNSGTFLMKLGISGTGDYEFSFPTEVVTDSVDKMYVADSLNNRIQIFQFDKEGPTGTLDFNIPKTVIDYYDVTLNTLATDTLSTVTEMIISENINFTDSNWEAYAPTKEWTFDLEGLHTVYVKYRDTYNTESSSYSASITVQVTTEEEKKESPSSYIYIGETSTTETEEQPEEEVLLDEFDYKYVIIDANGNIIPNAKILISGQTYITNENGEILLGSHLENGEDIEFTYNGEVFSAVVDNQNIRTNMPEEQPDEPVTSLFCDDCNKSKKCNWFICLLIVVTVLTASYYTWKKYNES